MTRYQDKPTAWRWYWLLLIVIGFGVPEAVAILRKETHKTFSAAWWQWLGAFRKAKYRWARGVSFITFWCGLGLHFYEGWPAWPYLIGPAVPLSVLIVLSMLVWKENR